jgi:vWA found in TerF C terminus
MGLPLKKKAELVGLRIKKFGVPDNMIARVVLVNDGSGSMSDLYGVPANRFPRDHVSVMQETIDRVLAVAVRFDDNQSLEQFIFNDTAQRLPDATPESFGTYVKEQLLPNYHGGSTVYSSALREIVATYDNPPTDDDEPTEKKGFFGRFFGGSKAEAAPKLTKAPTDTTLPMFVMFITDGENASNDVANAERWIQETGKRNIYVMFLGIGDENFRTISALAEKYGNVGFAALTNLADVSDEKLYELLLNEEFCNWIKQFAPATV